MTDVIVSALLLIQLTVLRVHDGDTFTSVDRTRWRLWGIDAPERNQHCGKEACGWLAKEHLERLLRSGGAICTQVGTSYDRMVGKCQSAGRDLSGAMVSAGWAFDYRRFSGGEYSDEEAEARSAKRGMWAMSGVVNPSEWRRVMKPSKRRRR